jgi:hypothetical protein
LQPANEKSKSLREDAKASYKSVGYLQTKTSEMTFGQTQVESAGKGRPLRYSETQPRRLIIRKLEVMKKLKDLAQVWQIPRYLRISS